MRAFETEVRVGVARRDPAATDGGAAHAENGGIRLMSADQVRTDEIRLDAQCALVVDTNDQRLVVGGAEELGRRIGAGVAGQRPRRGAAAAVVDLAHYRTVGVDGAYR